MIPDPNKPMPGCWPLTRIALWVMLGVFWCGWQAGNLADKLRHRR